MLTDLRREGDLLVMAAGPGAIKGRNTARPGEQPRHMDVGKAWLFFHKQLAGVLDLPAPEPTTKEASL
mgnify:CR=1 FL=1